MIEHNNDAYESPLADVLIFSEEDIVTISGGDGGVDLPFHPWE